MEKQYLIDKNAIIDYLGSKLPPSGMDFMNKVVDNLPIISVITKIELLSFNAIYEHYQMLTNFTLDSNILGLNNTIVDLYIAIRKKYKTKLPDAIIAATAHFHNLTLITHNYSDFIKLTDLLIIDPHLIKN